MKARIKDLGFLIKASQYSESSLILKAFTHDHGLVSIIAKGIRKKPEASLLVPLNKYEFTLYEPQDGSLYLLSEFALMQEHNLCDKVECWSVAECALELYSQLIIPTEESPLYYSLWEVLVNYLDTQDKNAILIWWRFLLRVLILLGIPLHTELCSLCSKTDQSIAAFEKGSGKLLCQECWTEFPEAERYERLTPLSSRIMLIFPQIGDYIKTLNLDGISVRQINQLMADYYFAHFNKALNLRSLSVIEQFYN